MKKIIDKIITAASVGVIAYAATSVALNKAKADRRKAKEVHNEVDKLSAEIKAEYEQYSAEIEAAHSDFKVSSRVLSPEESASVLEAFGVFDVPVSKTISVVNANPDEGQKSHFKEECFKHFSNDEIIIKLKGLVREPNGGVLKGASYHGDCMALVGKLNEMSDTWEPVDFNITHNIATLLEVTDFKSMFDNQDADAVHVNRHFLKAYLVEAMQAIARII